MSKVLTVLTAAAMALGLTTRPALAEAAAKLPGSLTVYDGAKLFSPAGIDQAKKKLSGTRFDRGLKVTVDTYAEVPEDRKGEAEAAKGDRRKWHDFMQNWAKSLAQRDEAKGIYILIVEKPVGGVAVIADRQTRERGFTDADEQKVWDILVSSLQKANKEEGPEKKQEIRSGGLAAAMDYIVSDLKDTTVAGAAAGSKQRAGTGGGMSIGGWICLGLFVLLGVWLVIGIIRAFSGGGGGYGGGGGGFGSSLLGGLFGAMAGMWLYNSFFGGGGGMFGGASDAYAGDAGAGDVDTGAGDFGGESGAAGGYDGGGGDWGGGDVGGGDFGGDF